MPRVNIKTLTPVHIGSGRELMANTEFVEFVKDDDRLITVIDEKKVLDIIGAENIDQWVGIINRQENLKEYLLQRRPNLQPSDIEKRSMYVYGGAVKPNTTLKEQMLSAGEYPVIPGSSIKGAIRTAVIEYLIKKHTDEAREIISRKRSELARQNRKWSLKDFQFVESDILNKLLSDSFKADANKNIFRFLQVSDAIFPYATMATNVQILNLQRNGWDIKKGTNQLTETIAQECETEIRIKIDGLQLKKNITKGFVKTDSSFLKDIGTLFNILNMHTNNLLTREIKLWTEMEEDYPDELIGYYIDNLKKVKSTATACKSVEAVLRIGSSSGWDFITGAWAKTNEDIFSEDEWFDLSKLLNKGRDVEYFPKTRKLDEDGDILGFVKLSC